MGINSTYPAAAYITAPISIFPSDHSHDGHHPGSGALQELDVGGVDVAAQLRIADQSVQLPRQRLGQQTCQQRQVGICAISLWLIGVPLYKY